jgi:hypothetical protein
MRGPLCPVDPSHGVLIDWPTDRWAYHCPSQQHDGWKDRPATRAWFTTTEAETGLLIEAPRPSGEPVSIPAAASDIPSGSRVRAASRTDGLPGGPQGSMWELPATT